MSQVISVEKSVIEELVQRVNKLEKIVYSERYLVSIKKYHEEKSKGVLKKLKNPEDLFV